MKYTSIKDEKYLVKKLQKGSFSAFNTLFKKYSGPLYRLAYGYLKSETDSEELIQEVFTKIWEKRLELKEELSLKSYLFTIAFNIIKKHFRTKKYLSEYFNSKIYHDFDMQTSQRIIYNSLHHFVEEIVNELPERRKEIFIKSRFEGLSIQEIAAELKISHKTVENHLTSALRFIRRHLIKENILIA